MIRVERFFFFFSKYLYHAVVHNFENYRSSHNCSTKFQLWGGFPSTLSFSQPFNRAILVSVYVFLLLNRLLHAQKVIIFMVAYSKVGDILWKWKQNFKHLFIFIFIITFYISQQQWTLKSWNPPIREYYKLKIILHWGTVLILVWKSINSYYMCNSTSHVM